MRTQLRTALALGLAAGLLAACGGGGGDGNTAPAGPFNVAVAWQNFLTASRTYTVGGTANGHTISVTVTNAPVSGAATYPRTNTAATRVNQSASTVIDGGAPTVAGVAVYYTGTANVIGVDNGDGTCNDITTVLPLPNSANTGASGALDSSTYYSTCAVGGTTTIGSDVATWSLEVDGGVNLFCVNTTGRDGTGTIVGASNECIEVRADGTLASRARLSLSAPGTPTVVLYSS